MFESQRTPPYGSGPIITILNDWDEAILVDRIRTLEQMVARLEHMIIDLADSVSHGDELYWEDAYETNQFANKIIKRDNLYA